MLDRGLMAGTNVNTSASGSITGFSDCGQATAIEWAVGAVLHYCTDAGDLYAPGSGDLRPDGRAPHELLPADEQITPVFEQTAGGVSSETPPGRT